MKKIIYLLILTSAIAFGQNKKAERMKALRVAYISQKLELTPEEAQKFWPIYNQFEAKQIELRRKNKRLNESIEDKNNSEKEIFDAIDASENIEAELLENRKKFIKNLQGVLPAQKIIQLKQLENEFKKTVLMQLKNQK